MFLYQWLLKKLLKKLIVPDHFPGWQPVLFIPAEGLFRLPKPITVLGYHNIIEFAAAVLAYYHNYFLIFCFLCELLYFSPMLHEHADSQWFQYFQTYVLYLLLFLPHHHLPLSYHLYRVCLFLLVVVVPVPLFHLPDYHWGRVSMHLYSLVLSRFCPLSISNFISIFVRTQIHGIMAYRVHSFMPCPIQNHSSMSYSTWSYAYVSNTPSPLHSCYFISAIYVSSISGLFSLTGVKIDWQKSHPTHNMKQMLLIVDQFI